MRALFFLLGFALVFQAINANKTAPVDCVKKCGLNEEFSECDNIPCANTCEEPDLITRCTYAPGCYPGCICKQGFLKNKSGKCVPTKTCYKCKKNEVFTDCGANGCQNTCANPELSTVCDPFPGCFPGCICKPGFLRDESTGNCVSRKKCPANKCKGENEVFSACDANPCQNTCEEPNRLASCSYIAGCYPGCICGDGFLRNADGVCVPRGPCLSNLCKADNEEYQECGTACPLTCENKDESIICTLQCVEGCFCKSGFVRDANGSCVSPDTCPSTKTCSKPNEVYSECGNNSCQRNCDTYDRTDIACRPICTPGCICQDGYIRNQNGVCVTPDQCENRQCKGENEAYTGCVCPCCETCATLGQNVTCNFLVCNAGCDCKPGFFRNSKGVCVAPENCDCRENETLDLCFNPCPPRSCDAIGKAFKCPATDPTTCKPACTCSFNFRRDSEGVCIPIQKCPPLECTGKNEVYDSCPFQCLDERCESLYETPRPCPKIKKECAPQCVCQSGYLRDKNGVCIPKEKCEEYCSDPKTVFDPCGDIYPITCANKDKLRIKASDCFKKGGCVCRSQYVRDYKGNCVLPEECPSCSDPHEIFKCGPPCDTTCDTVGQKNEIIDGKCVEMCYCVDGYVRNAENNCIPIKQCPKKPCKKNETYNQCPVSCPPEETCESYLSGVIVDCAPPPEDRECIPRCECSPGFVRKTPGGECIKAESCCEDPNAEVVSCPNPCPGGTCLAPEFVPCKRACKIRGCQCKKGFVKDANDKCILLSKCPKPKKCTGQNEEFQECGTACPLTCKNKDDNIICTEQCVPGCFCIPKFVRKNGVCVHPKDCGCGNNETYSAKAPTIQETCDTIGKKPKCKTGPGCVCLPGFVRKCAKGKCIKVKDCKK